MDDLKLDDLDRDGALAEAIGGLHDRTRAGFLRGAMVGGGALLTAFATPASAAGGKARDVSILNFALTLEELQAAFYTEVERNKVLEGGLKRQATTVGATERAHVRAFRSALGSAARGAGVWPTMSRIHDTWRASTDTMREASASASLVRLVAAPL